MITRPVSIPVTPSRTPMHLIRALGIGAGTLVLLTAAFLALHMSRVPADLDVGRTQLSQNGLFQMSYKPARESIPLNELQSWTLEVTTPDGRGVEGATIKVDGEMPGHGHGLASQPQVTQDLGGGRYLLEGLKFQMSGRWVVTATVTDHEATDLVIFNLLLD